MYLKKKTYWALYANKIENVDEMDNFLGKNFTEFNPSCDRKQKGADLHRRNTEIHQGTTPQKKDQAQAVSK